jgi:Tol biopolymer transport system component
VVYVDDGGSGHFDLFIVHRDHRLRQVTHLPTGSDAFFPDWAPDGSEIAFVLSTSAGSQIYTVRPDGTGLHQITNDPQFSSDSPRWSPDGRQLVFSRSAPHGFCDTFASERQLCHIWVMNADGTTPRQLTNSGFWNDFDPAWSPDGSTIAFDSNRGGLTSALWVMHADGSSLTRITKPRVEGWWPTWSADSGRLAFTRQVKNAGLFAMDAHSGGIRQVLPGGTSSHDFPSWSAGRIAFAAVQSDGTTAIETVRPDGTDLTVLVAGLHDGLPFMDYLAG